MAPPPPMLMEEVLLRFPPHEPALLVRVSLVCKRWRRLVWGPSFRRRFRELHRTPPMLGFACNILDEDRMMSSFVTSTRFCSPDAGLIGGYRPIDARHGRVLLQRFRNPGDALVLWDPIADERRELPLPPRFTSRGFLWTAAVLCDADGACSHLNCHRGPFLVVLLASGSGKAFICTYSSDAATWSDPIAMEHSTDQISHCSWVQTLLVEEVWP
ncbi:hypothetical protein HU200_016462 [Digitaria exilis]|uniref:F-box domain-containing protein n=1 Tax=Digitaria exilis TaxID=1010633 RepID=A0A835F8Y1_9POAL|nr:hypothetical protein HU200_066355 [Digitaria exilis]KAF8731401.1 hypothetical protein HU200_016462 [Digitaria exilis]